MLTVQGRVIIHLQDLTDFSAALAVQYQEEASTLEFTQRFVHHKLIQEQDNSNCHDSVTCLLSK